MQIPGPKQEQNTLKLKQRKTWGSPHASFVSQAATKMEAYLWYQPGSLDSLINRNYKRPDEKLRQGFIGASGAARVKKTSNSFPCSLPEVGSGGAGSLNGVSVGTDQWGRRCVLGTLPTPLWCCVQGSWFCSWHLRSSSWVLAFLHLIVHNCPDCMCVVIFSPF